MLDSFPAILSLLNYEIKPFVFRKLCTLVSYDVYSKCMVSCVNNMKALQPCNSPTLQHMAIFQYYTDNIIGYTVYTIQVTQS